MEPTIRANEKFAANPNSYRDSAPRRGDVVIFEHEDVLQVKRVVAAAGDTIRGEDFKIFLNGQVLHEGYIQHAGPRQLQPSVLYLSTFGPVKVPEGYIFVMGDNRDYSHDSRDPTYGLISIASVRGQALRIVESSDPKRVGSAIQ